MIYFQYIYFVNSWFLVEGIGVFFKKLLYGP